MPNRVVIYGGRGGLGSTLVKSFKSKGKTVARKNTNREYFNFVACDDSYF